MVLVDLCFISSIILTIVVDAFVSKKMQTIIYLLKHMLMLLSNRLSKEEDFDLCAILSESDKFD